MPSAVRWLRWAVAGDPADVETHMWLALTYTVVGRPEQGAPLVAKVLEMDPLTPLDTLCRIILRAKEYEAQVPSDYDAGEEADNVDGEDGEALSVLDDDTPGAWAMGGASRWWDASCCTTHSPCGSAS